MYVGKCSICGNIAPLGLDDRCEECLNETFRAEREE